MILTVSYHDHVDCPTETMQLVRERVRCCKPSYTMSTDCPAKQKIRKVPCLL